MASNELGYGNIAQVVGFKAGMLTGGGLLLWASTYLGTRGHFVAMAALVLLAVAATGLCREHPPAEASAAPRDQHIADVLATLWRWLRMPGSGWVVVVIASYKLGETVADTMFKPFVLDAGFSRSQIGLWVGSWGMLFSMLGSFAGGLLASQRSLVAALAITATARTVPVFGQWWLSLAQPSSSAVILVTCSEHLFGGALTTAMFAFMMSHVDKSIGGTHYTALAAIEVFGKSPAAWLSGYLAQAWGYTTVFAGATLASIAYLPLLLPIARKPTGTRR